MYCPASKRRRECSPSLAENNLAEQPSWFDGKHYSLALVHTDGRSAALRTRNIGERAVVMERLEPSRQPWSFHRKRSTRCDKKGSGYVMNFPRGRPNA